MNARAAIDAAIIELRKCPFIPQDVSDGLLGTLAGVVYMVMHEHSCEYVGGIPEGWQLVPVDDPTPAMLRAGVKVVDGLTTLQGENLVCAMFQEMCAVAPQAERDISPHSEKA